MGKKRISKKQLKEDAFVSATFEIGHYVQENLTRIIVSTLGLLLLFGMAWFYINFRRERIQQAELAMFKAENLYLNGQYALAAADFEKIITDYSGTLPAKKAVFFAGDSYYKSGDYGQALFRFEESMKVMPADDPLQLNAMMGKAAVHEQMKEYDQALQTLKSALDLASFDYQKVEIMDAQGRVFALAGKKQEAVGVLDSLIQGFPESPILPRIVERRAELQAQIQAEKNEGQG